LDVLLPELLLMLLLLLLLLAEDSGVGVLLIWKLTPVGSSPVWPLSFTTPKAVTCAS
jgi:hypothetical protein